MKNIPILERFMSKVNKTKDCWLWTAGKQKKFGYGTFSFNAWTIYAHRMSYQLFVGEIPEGICVLHKCDNPACVNPEHLFLGTKADNCRDRTRKGRTAKHEGHGRAKLTKEQVLKIRSDLRSQSVIAKDYGVYQTIISRIKSKKIWSGV